VACAFSGEFRNVLMPSGRVHRNISSTRKYACSRATITTSDWASTSMETSL
jgi:hypothetical protein